MNFFSEPQTINIDNVTALLHDVCTAIAESVGAVKRSELANHLTMQKWPHVLLGFNLALITYIVKRNKSYYKYNSLDP